MSIGRPTQRGNSRQRLRLGAKRNGSVRVNSQTPTPLRSPPPEGIGLVALESAMDELAHELGVDPLELRERNYADKDPMSGNPWSSNGLLECYKRGAERFGWSRRNPKPGAMREGGELIGMGMASGSRFALSQPAGARVRLDEDGSALVQTGSQGHRHRHVHDREPGRGRRARSPRGQGAH